MEKAIDDLLATGESALCPIKSGGEGGGDAELEAYTKPQSQAEADVLLDAFKSKVQELNAD